MDKEQKAAIEQMKKALRAYLHAHEVLERSWEDFELQFNEFGGSQAFEKHYPFDKSIVDYNVRKWVHTSLDRLNRPFVAPTDINIDNEETNIKSIETQQTGGHVYNDVITLKDGIIIRISDGGLSVFKNAKADEDNDEVSFIEFPDTEK